MRVDLGARRVHVGRLEEAPGDPGRPLYLPHPVGAAGPGQHAVAVPVARLVAPVAPALSVGRMICLSIRTLDCQRVPREWLSDIPSQLQDVDEISENFVL